jgi:hypothetical protein
VEEAFTVVAELTAEVFQAQFGGTIWRLRLVCLEERGVGRAKIYGNVSAFPGYAKWLENSMMSQ